MVAQPQSPAFDQVVEKFGQALKDDESIDQKAADRLMSLLKSGGTVNVAKVEEALFPEPHQDGPAT